MSPLGSTSHSYWTSSINMYFSFIYLISLHHRHSWWNLNLFIWEVTDYMTFFYRLVIGVCRSLTRSFFWEVRMQGHNLLMKKYLFVLPIFYELTRQDFKTCIVVGIMNAERNTMFRFPYCKPRAILKTHKIRGVTM